MSQKDSLQHCSTRNHLVKNHLAILPTHGVNDTLPIDLLWRRHNAFIFSTCNVIEGALEMPPRIFKRGRVLIRLEVGVDEFNEAV